MNQYHYDGIRRTYLKYQYTQGKIKIELTTMVLVRQLTKNSVSSTFTEGNNFLVVPESVISVINIFSIFR